MPQPTTRRSRCSWRLGSQCLPIPSIRPCARHVPQFETFVQSLSYGFRPFHPTLPSMFGGIGGMLSEAGKNPNANLKDGLAEVVRVENAKLAKWTADNA